MRKLGKRFTEVGTSGQDARKTKTLQSCEASEIALSFASLRETPPLLTHSPNFLIHSDFPIISLFSMISDL